MNLGHFVGSAPTLFNSLLLLFPERVITVWAGDPFAPAALYHPLSTSEFPHTSPHALAPKEQETRRLLGTCGGDPTKYYQFFLASDLERAHAQAAWNAQWDFSGLWPGNWDWNDWAFWTEDWWTRRRRESCRVTHTFAVLPLLRRLFGDWWKAPASTVSI